MPRYEITSPDGQRYEVNAPDGATEEEVMSYAQQQFGQTKPAEQPPAQPPAAKTLPDGQTPGVDYSMTKGMEDGTTFGFSDEMRSFGRGLGAMMVGRDYNDAYNRRYNQLKQEREAAKNANPWAYTGGEITGAGLQAGAMLPLAGINGVSKFTQAHPYVTAAGAGTLQGGLYGQGTSEGTAEQRFTNGAVPQAITGMVLAPTLTFAARTALGPLTSKVLQYLEKKKGASVPIGAPSTYAPVNSSQMTQAQKSGLTPSQMGLTEADNVQLAKMQKAEGNIFAMTEGQRTQSPQAQRLESGALAGHYGPDAANIAQMARNQQSRERGNFLKQLGEIDSTDDVGGVFERALDTIKSQAKSAKAGIDSAYSLAREGGGVKISVDDIKDGLFARVVETKRQGQYDLGSMPYASNVAKDLVRLIRGTQGGKFTSAKLGAMENWRTRVTNALNSSQDATERKFLGKMLSEYDGFMRKTADEAVDLGDQNAIMAFREAVQKRAEYGRLYENNDFVDRIVRGQTNIDDAVKELAGTGSIAGKKQMEQTLDALLKAAGNEKEVVLSDLQTAYAKKLFQQSVEGLEANNPEVQFLSAAKMQKALESLFVNNRAFATKLYGKNAVHNALQAIEELNKIKTLQPSTSNPSGSADTLLRFMQKSKLFNLPGINIFTGSMERALKTSTVNKVEKSLSAVINDIAPTPTSKMFLDAAARKIGAEQADINNKEPEVTITPLPPEQQLR